MTGEANLLENKNEKLCRHKSYSVKQIFNKKEQWFMIGHLEWRNPI